MQYKTQSDQPILVFLYQANKCNLRYTLDFWIFIVTIRREN